MQLTPDQAKNARAIVEEGKKLGIDKKGIQIALMTALAESGLRNLANTGNPESKKYADKDNNGQPMSGSDHDSVGIFQQRPQYWGNDIPKMMDPHIAADRFFKGIGSTPGLSSVDYHTMDTWKAAQAVQRSFDPTGSNYRQWLQGSEDLETQLGVQ